MPYLEKMCLILKKKKICVHNLCYKEVLIQKFLVLIISHCKLPVVLFVVFFFWLSVEGYMKTILEVFQIWQEEMCESIEEYFNSQ